MTIRTRNHVVRIVQAFIKPSYDRTPAESTINRIQAMGPSLAAQISDPGIRNILIASFPSQRISDEVLDEYNPTSRNIRMIYTSITISSEMFSLSWPELNDRLGGNVDSVLSNILADALRNSAYLAGYDVIVDTLFGEILATVTIRIKSMDIV